MNMPNCCSEGLLGWMNRRYPGSMRADPESAWEGIGLGAIFSDRNQNSTLGSTPRERNGMQLIANAPWSDIEAARETSIKLGPSMATAALGHLHVRETPASQERNATRTPQKRSGAAASRRMNTNHSIDGIKSDCGGSEKIVLERAARSAGAEGSSRSSGQKVHAVERPSDGERSSLRTRQVRGASQLLSRTDLRSSPLTAVRRGADPAHRRVDGGGGGAASSVPQESCGEESVGWGEEGRVQDGTVSGVGRGWRGGIRRCRVELNGAVTGATGTATPGAYSYLFFLFF